MCMIVTLTHSTLSRANKVNFRNVPTVYIHTICMHQSRNWTRVGWHSAEVSSVHSESCFRFPCIYSESYPSILQQHRVPVYIHTYMHRVPV